MKRTVLLSILSLFFISIIGFLVWKFVLVNESEVRNAEVRLQEDSEVNKYFINVFISRDKEVKVIQNGEYKKIPYMVSGNYNEEFENLSDSDKKDFFLKLIDKIGDRKGLLRLGHNKYTDIEKIWVLHNDSGENMESYEFDLFNNQIIHTYKGDKGLIENEVIN